MTKNALYDIVPVMIPLQHEVDLLKEWFKKDYPESDLRVVCDFNAVLHTLKIEIEMLMGEEVSSNRLHTKKQIVLTERDLRNEALTYGFIKEFNKQMRTQIQNSFNLHYAQEKQRLGIE